MTNSSAVHDTHSGGVVRVQVPRGSWGAVPIALLEDVRLSLDARAVSCWLATRPGGWQIAIRPLCQALGLGRDRWRRIARELELSGYLSRSVAPTGPRGQMRWTNVFCAVPATMDGLSGDGQTGDGRAVAGAGGDKSHKDFNQKDLTQRERETALALSD